MTPNHDQLQGIFNEILILVSRMGTPQPPETLMIQNATDCYCITLMAIVDMTQYSYIRT